jgi:hypothetical protein
MNLINKYLAWGAGVLALLIALAVALPGGKVRGFDVSGFGTLPILEGGRIKPLDSLARNSLLLIHSRQGFRHDGRMVGPDEWILDVLFRPQVADQQPIFVIDDPEVISLIGGKQTKNRNYFSFAELARTSTRSRSRLPRRNPLRPRSAPGSRAPS